MLKDEDGDGDDDDEGLRRGAGIVGTVTIVNLDFDVVGDEGIVAFAESPTARRRVFPEVREQSIDAGLLQADDDGTVRFLTMFDKARRQKKKKRGPRRGTSDDVISDVAM